MSNWIENESKISDIQELLLDNEVEIDSPDGFVGVSEFVDKGTWEEYLVTDIKGNCVSVNENHLFQTLDGWVLTKNLQNGDLILKDDGEYHPIQVTKTGNMVPIVDIVVEHENHRYYANGFSSHNTNVGKSLAMCHMAAAALSQGKNVLYITMEMAEEKIAERIDANLMNVELDDLPTLDKSAFLSRFDMRIVKKTHGKLIIKEYPTSTAHVGHFRHLFNELRLKKKFIPDIVFVDYINICASQRMKLGGSNNSYTVVKAIAEELRGLAVEKDIPLWSATQSNRGAQNSADIGLDDTAESFGLPQTADFMIAIMEPEDLKEMGQFLVKQLKNRYRDKNKDAKFVIGVDKGKQRLTDVSNATSVPYIQNGSTKPEPDVPSFDKGNFGSRLNRGGKERADGFNFDV